MTGGWANGMRILVVLLLTGCLTPTDSTLPIPVLETPVALFKSVVLPDEAARSFEPGVEVAPDGTIYACAPRGVARSGTLFWRSLDGGATFEQMGMPLPADGPIHRTLTGDVGGGDCDIAVDSTGKIYLVDLYGAGVSILTSEDRGETWNGSPVSTLPGDADRPWVTTGKAGEVFVTAAWIGQATNVDQYRLDMPPVGGIWVARSTDGGATFPQQGLAAGNERRLGLNGNIAVAGDDVFVMYTKKIAEGQMAVMLAISHDRGATWTQQVAVEQAFYPRQCFSPVDIFPVVTTDGVGGVYLAWVLANPETGRQDLFFASSADGGATWNAPVIVTDRNGTRRLPWIDAAGPGRVGIVWYETDQPSLLRLTPDLQGSVGMTCEDSLPEDAQWFIHYALLENATSAQPTVEEALVQPGLVNEGPLDAGDLMQVDFDPEGRANIAYMARDEDGLMRSMFARERDP